MEPRTMHFSTAQGILFAALAGACAWAVSVATLFAVIS